MCEWPEKGTADLGQSGLEGAQARGGLAWFGGAQILSGYLSFLKTCSHTASLAVSCCEQRRNDEAREGSCQLGLLS